MMTIRAQITVTSGHAHIRMNYDHQVIAELKDSIPNWARRYDPTTRIWRIERAYLDQAVTLLRAHFGCDSVHVTGAPTTVAAQPNDTNWAVTLFDQAPEHLREPLFKSLIRVLHPDSGGDRRLAQELIDARAAVRRAS